MAQMEKIKFLSEIEAPALSIDGQEVATKQEVENIVGDASVIKPGAGEYSVQTESTNAIGDYSTAFGFDTVAGMKAYYYSGINPTTKKIYLFGIKAILSWGERQAYNYTPVYGDEVTDDAYLNTNFATPAWNVGDWLGIINNHHYIYQIQVAAVHDNVIEYTGELGFDKIPRDTTTKAVDITSDVSCIANSQFYTISGNTYKNATIKFNYEGTRLYNFDDESSYWGVLLGSAEITGDLSSLSVYPLSIDFETITGLEPENFAIDKVTITEATYPTLVPAWDTGSDSYTVFNLDNPSSGAFSMTYANLAIGEKTKAIGSYAVAVGYNNTAYNQGFAFGTNCIAGYSAHAEGGSTQAWGEWSHAEGGAEVISGETYRTRALGNYSHAEGQATIANGTAAHSENYRTTAKGWASHAEGSWTEASGEGAHAEGSNTKATANYTHSEGRETTASFEFAHSEGYKTTASNHAAHSEGYNSRAEGWISHAEGNATLAKGTSSHAEGDSSHAYGTRAHAEGYGTRAGESNIAANNSEGAHAEGRYTHARGKGSHAEGGSTYAIGDYSHAGGYATEAHGPNQTTIGTYNAIDKTSLFIIGNGTGSGNLRKNALTVSGTGDLALCAGGSVKVGSTVVKEEQLQSINTFDINREKLTDYATSFNGVGGDVESFMYFTDPHLAGFPGEDWRPSFNKYMNTLSQYYKEAPVDQIFCGGDWLDNSESNREACYRLGLIGSTMREKFKYSNIIVGNHDTNEQGEALLEPGVIRNLMFRDQDMPYYCVDTKLTKFIVLDTRTAGKQVDNAYETYQVEWFIEQLMNNTKPYLVLMPHMVYISNIDNNTINTSKVQPLMQEITLIAKQFNSRSSYTFNGKEYNFSGKTGTVKFIMAGHNHLDYVGSLNSIPVIITTNLEKGGSPTFDLCFINYSSNIIKLKRIGSGSDREILI